MRIRSTLALLALLHTACGGNDGTPAATADDELTVVEDGKADNYYSDVAAEFEVSGRLPVKMTDADYADEARRADLVSRRLTAFGLYLTTYVTDKFRGLDENGDGQITDDEIFFRNDTYGGFHAMVRNYSVQALDVQSDGNGGYEVDFTIDVAGPRELPTLVPRVEGNTTGDPVFDVQMPKDLTIDPASVPWGEIRKFDPKTYAGEVETVRCTMRPEAEVKNAYPAYSAFFADGVYDITLFYGYDYNTARSDLQEARSAFALLQQLGFTAPVATFDDLKADSGPFVRKAKANGKEARIEVRIFHADMFKDDRRLQHDLAISELVTRDVFFYLGHAGPYYGFYLDEAGEAQVDYHELMDAPFTDKQQLVLAQGCQTYSQYADMLYANPAKSEDNLDVITTINFSYGQGSEALLKSLIRSDKGGHHQPVAFYQLIGDLNADWINKDYTVFYGVMGVDGDTRLHPYANVGAIGADCRSASTCGDPDGNACLKVSGRKQCAALAIAADDCPAGTTFKRVARRDTIIGGACIAAP